LLEIWGGNESLNCYVSFGKEPWVDLPEIWVGND